MNIDPNQLLATGAMTGPHRLSFGERLRMAKRSARQEISRVREFLQVYRLYRRAAHSMKYAARIAYGCVYRGLPF